MANKKANEEISKMFTELDLVDIWRDQHPTTRRYTWKGNKGQRGRLDYFAVSADLIDKSSSDIENNYFSDHSTISLSIDLHNQPHGRGFWKFNNSLLKDKDYVNKIKKCIIDTVDTYRIDDKDSNDEKFTINDQLLWETLKLMIRGETIPYASHKKKERDKRENDIENRLRQLNDDLNKTTDQNKVEQEIDKVLEELKLIRQDKIEGLSTRAKAKWHLEGEKPTNYFCNLEKFHRSEKTMEKLILDNKEEITDIKDIVNEQKRYYETLYSSQGNEPSATLKTTFFDNNNPYFNRLTPTEADSCEGQIERHECAKALKDMPNFKSPGTDGFTVEFYKFFWKDIGDYVLRSIQYAYNSETMSITQRQGVILNIPKKDKDRTRLKNWRPISLLNIDYKIATAVIANRLKANLGNIISISQNGYLKDRSTSDCTRLVYDVIENRRRKQLTGMLLLLDFEKAFDSLEWHMIDNSLNFFGFGPSIRKWVKIFYKNISSCILNNGHISSFFNIKRGVRQGDPLSPYLFLIAVEVLSGHLKYHPEIRGISFRDTEYLISQLADDTTLLLDGTYESLKQVFAVLDDFKILSGLKLNFSKTEAIWLGSDFGSMKEYDFDFKLKWNHEGVFKLLGITYDLGKDDITFGNYEDKMKTIQKTLKNWTLRNLTLIGKVTIIKTLIIPQLVHLFTSLPNPPNSFFKDIETEIFKFIWDNKNDKIKRGVLYCAKEDGGLNLQHLPSFCNSLKLTWLGKIFKNERYPWKLLFNDECNLTGGHSLLFNLHPKSIENVAKTLNPFWNDMLSIWTKLNAWREPAVVGDVLRQSIHRNPFIRIQRKTIYRKHWIESGFVYIADIIENGKIMELDEINETYDIGMHHLDYRGLLEAIPKEWLNLIRNDTTNCMGTPNPFLKGILSKKNLNQFFYNYVVKPFRVTAPAIEKWELELNLNDTDWVHIYDSNFRSSCNTKIQNFQYKFLHRAIYTNSRLFKMKIVESEKCTFCKTSEETIDHLFWDCSITKKYIHLYLKFLKEKCNYDLNLSKKDFFLGLDNIENELLGVNYSLCMLKYSILQAKCKNSIPKFEIYFNNLTNIIRTEISLNRFERKWGMFGGAIS